MGISVAILAVLVRPSAQAPGTHITANGPPAQVHLLARFDPPAYGGDPAGSRDLRAAMQRYSKRDYEGAIPELSAILDSNPGLVEARYYLGVCLLLTGKSAAGTAELRNVIAGGDTPYREPAHFYLAKALLGFGDTVGARHELEVVIASGGGWRKEAHALLAQLK